MIVLFFHFVRHCRLDLSFSFAFVLFSTYLCSCSSNSGSASVLIDDFFQDVILLIVLTCRTFSLDFVRHQLVVGSHFHIDLLSKILMPISKNRQMKNMLLVKICWNWCFFSLFERKSFFNIDFSCNK